MPRSVSTHASQLFECAGPAAAGASYGRGRLSGVRAAARDPNARAVRAHPHVLRVGTYYFMASAYAEGLGTRYFPFVVLGRSFNVLEAHGR